MEKLYEKDLNFLEKELEHHTYIAEKFSQEHDTERAQEFKILCEEIRISIQTMKMKQAIAIDEWSALSEKKRQAIITPLIDAVEESATKIKENNCPVFSEYFEQFLSHYLIDLIELI